MYNLNLVRQSERGRETGRARGREGKGRDKERARKEKRERERKRKKDRQRQKAREIEREGASNLLGPPLNFEKEYWERESHASDGGYKLYRLQMTAPFSNGLQIILLTKCCRV